MENNKLDIEVTDFDLEFLLQQTKINIPLAVVRRLVQKWEEIRIVKDHKLSEQQRLQRIDEDMKEILKMVDQDLKS